jgi:hypothetical protein
LASDRYPLAEESKKVQLMNAKTDPATEVDLIKVKVIERKHVEQLMTSVGMQSETKPNEVDFLYYITDRDAILARRKDNGHLTVIRTLTYYSWVMDHRPEGQDYNSVRAEAYAVVHRLPQLFVD